jgi:hypothetical protein
MKELKKFSNQTEAHLSKSLLASNGIIANIVGAKEYASHFLGGEQGQYTLFVEEHDFTRAKELLDEVSRQITDSDGSGRPNYFRRAVFLSFAAIVILPVIFNIGAILNAKKFWDESAKDSAAVGKLVIIGILQIPTLFILFYMYKFFGDIAALFSGSGLGDF